jgi:hypothetical protein
VGASLPPAKVGFYDKSLVGAIWSTFRKGAELLTEASEPAGATTQHGPNDLGPRVGQIRRMLGSARGREAARGRSPR